ncbi:MAG: P-II family nitrogen regulator [Gammaproteobacteria bacterium]|uniref:P-II family nitrogen regulator n=1 Tax=Azohydromonas sp. TaxID=1872666 RepID=UPI002B9885DD|nr:transcriptional regulator [Azohydromonas sp.]HMM84650.1 transcriptional regulator [Azohydromonas sp.]
MTSSARHPKTLLVIVAEAVIERALVRDACRLGAQGWTVGEVRGAGAEGVREGAWEADRTIELKLICEAAVADAIADHVLATYAPHYAVAMYLSDVRVLRPQRY